MKNQTRAKRLLCFVLALVLLVPLAGQMAIIPAGAITQAEIDALKSNANSLASDKKALQNELKAIQADKSNAQRQKNLLERQINIIQSEIDNMADQIEKYGQMIDQKEIELADMQHKEAEQYELFCKRIRAMEEEGETSYWSILFASSNFSDMLDSFMMIEEIIEYDNGVMENLIAIREAIETEKTSLQESKTAQETAKQEQEAAKKELGAQEAQVDKLIIQISDKEDELEEREEQLKKAAAAMDAEIKRKEKELAAQIAKVVSESGFMWPMVGGYDTLSSLFGGRKHPVTGRPNNHTGIDIPAPRNTKIYAAKSGVVVTATYNNSYGNYVVVAHSDGTSTLYAHMNSRNAKEGQTVKQGDVVGYVGTTGSSTGNHLHFEIRINGNRVDPVNYFKDKTLYAKANGKTQLLKR